MKRDMDLIREILLAIEQADEDPRVPIELNLPGRSAKEIGYHVMLLHEAGLVAADESDLLGPEGFDWQPRHLTWDGHEFLDTARDDTIWGKAKGKMIEATGGLSLELLKHVLTAYGKEALGLGS